MDVNRLSTGQKIAGASGIALFIIMFIGWWGAPEVTVSLPGGGSVSGGGVGTANAWEAADFLDLVWALTAIAAVALAGLAATQTQTNLPVAMSSIVAGLGGLSVLTILFRLINTPFDATRKIGVFLGLIAAAGIAYGGWRAMQEEGTSFSAEADRVQGGGGPTAPPPGGNPPPPPPSGPAA